MSEPRSRPDLLRAALSGLLLGAAFMHPAAGVIALFAFVPLLGALERRVATGGSGGSFYALGYAGGFAFFLLGTHWIALLSDVATTVPWLKYVGWVLAAVYLANFWALAAWLAGTIARRSGVPARWTFVAAMLVIEELRGSGELGFPWFQPGYSQSASPAILLAAFGSVTLVTAWVLLVNALLARGRGRSVRSAVVTVSVALAGLLPGLVHELRHRHETAAGATVALVQGDIPGEIKWAGNHQDQILATFLALSDTAMANAPAGARPQLVVWPETATGSYLRKQVGQSIRVAQWCARNRVPVFTGFADYSYDAAGKALPWNAAGMWRADGSLSEIYAKRHLVPFGERMPFEWLIPALAKLDLGQAEWQPGTRTVLFDGPAGRFSCLVCFESIFPDLARRDVIAGSRMLVNITNDEWFGNSAALYQHAAMAPFRAVENGVPVLRCANTGLTEVIAPDGRVVAAAPVFAARVLSARIPPATGRTLYSRFGDWPGVLAFVAVALLLAAPWRRPRSNEGSRPER